MRASSMILAVVFVLIPTAGYADYNEALHQYLHGQYSEAAEGFRPLAEEGNPEAQYILGSMYATGKGVLQNYVRAHAWFNLAAAQGHEYAADYRDEIEGKMTSGQIAEAQQLASKLHSQPASREREAREDSDKDVVASIQKHLQDLGYYSGAIDGLMGPGTRKSIRSYQRDQDLPETGQPSRSLLEKMRETASEKALQKNLKYVGKGPWSQVLLHDEFSDGNYTYNPAWTKDSGDFWVTSNYFLRSERKVPESASADKEASSEEKAKDIFGKVVKEVMKSQGMEDKDSSEIYTPLEIGNAFALQVDLQVLSGQIGQSFELGVYQGQSRSAGYMLRFLNQEEQSLALVSFGGSGSSVIDVVRKDKLLREAEPQTLSLLRYKDGAMKVLIKGGVKA